MRKYPYQGKQQRRILQNFSMHHTESIFEQNNTNHANNGHITLTFHASIGGMMLRPVVSGSGQKGGFTLK